jgi:hypothetical protein
MPVRSLGVRGRVPAADVVGHPMPISTTIATLDAGRPSFCAYLKRVNFIEDLL